MAERVGDCTLCRDKDVDVTHLDLYVNGSEGIWACLNCRIALTNVATALQSVAGRATLQRFKR